MKRRTMTITITRDTLRELLEDHIKNTISGPQELKEFQVHQNGGITMVLAEKENTPLLEAAAEAERESEA